MEKIDRENKVKLEQKIALILKYIENEITTDQQNLNNPEVPQPIDSAALKQKLSQINASLKDNKKAIGAVASQTPSSVGKV